MEPWVASAGRFCVLFWMALLLSAIYKRNWEPAKKRIWAGSECAAVVRMVFHWWLTFQVLSCLDLRLPAPEAPSTHRGGGYRHRLSRFDTFYALGEVLGVEHSAMCR